jgi:peptidoglycan-associated lipoprotein
MTARAFIRAALALFVPASLAAQTPGMRPGSILVSAGVGSGSATFSCDVCAQRDAGLSELVRLGVVVRPSLLVAAELTGWAKSYADARGTADAGFRFINATVQWHPRPTSGFFVKAGGGLASIKDDITISSLGPTAIKTTGLGLVAGAGWNVPVRGLWALTPYADVNYAARAKQSINGQQREQTLGGTVMHIGLAATHGPLVIHPPRLAPPVAAPVVNQDSVDRARAEQARLDSVVRAQREQEARDRATADSIARAREAEAAREAVVARETEIMRATIVTTIYFDLEKADLRADARQALDAKLPILLANTDLRVRIAGNTDARGSRETNQQLADRRATATRDYLIARGVSAARVEIVSYGKDRPVCAIQDEQCFARNRRAEFEILDGGGRLKKP